MKVLVASDSYKGSLSSIEVGEAIKKGVLKAIPDSEVVVRPASDGGDGMLDIMLASLEGERIQKVVKGPLGNRITAEYGIVNKNVDGDIKKIAVIEMAAAAGLSLIDKKDYDPLITTTYGVGELIADAISRGIYDFIIGLGGSATNDGGLGMLKALGYDFFGKDGVIVGEGASALIDIERIGDKNVIPTLHKCSFKVACDVTNPLVGENGCSYVYGPQKGAPEDMLENMDFWMEHYAYVAKQFNHKADKFLPGSGAAGGLGFACATFLNAKLIPGIKIILEETELEKYVKEADLVITGEGRLDGQTIKGKTPIGVAKLAKKYGKKVLLFAGSLGADADKVSENGVDAYYKVTPSDMPLAKAMERETAENNISTTVEKVLNEEPLL